MRGSESVAGLERLADAFGELALVAPELMVDRDTRAPAAAIGWHAARNFRVRLRREPSGAQASAYYRVGGDGLELMLATSAAGAGALADGDAAEGLWGRVRVPAGEEALSADLMLRRLRQRVR